MAEDDPLPKPAPEAEPAPPQEEEIETRTRLAEAQLQQAMDGYHSLRAENEALRAEIVELHEKQRAVTQDLGATLARHKRAAARELQSERETIHTRYIEILDNFDRAFDTPEARAASHSLMEGFILVRNQVVQVLRDGGFDRVRTLGLPYDPNTSEAIGLEEVEDPAKDGMVIRELVRGYRLDEHVVRAARVVVGRYSGPPKEDSGEILRAPEGPQDPGPPKEDSGETLRVPEEPDEGGAVRSSENGQK